MENKFFVNFFSDGLYSDEFSSSIKTDFVEKLTILKNNQVRGLYNVAISSSRSVGDIMKFVDHQRDKVKDEERDADSKKLLWKTIREKIAVFRNSILNEAKAANKSLKETDIDIILCDFLKEYIRHLYFDYTYRKTFIDNRRW